MLRSVLGLFNNKKNMAAVRFFSKGTFTNEEVTLVMQDIRKRNEETRLKEEADKFRKYIQDQNIWGQLKKTNVIKDDSSEKRSKLPIKKVFK